ncbi:MAG: hypothetical protein M1832_002758 [Thelocarpon impressellum]|nr:MAG: hypothetical protein M1832_002758 [Thelocarpon impressellum]
MIYDDGTHEMTFEVIHAPPAPDAFTPLSSHQSQTPSSFFSGQPVLHYEAHGARLEAARGQPSDFPLLSHPLISANGTTNGDGHAEEPGVVEDVHVWVTSTRLVLYSAAQQTGFSIDYHSITLHAIQRLRLSNAPADAPEQEGLYMQLTPSTLEFPSEDDMDDQETLDCTLVLPASSAPPQAAAAGESETETRRLFNAITTCANLHPSSRNSRSSSLGSSARETPIVFEGSVGYASGIPHDATARSTTGGDGLPPPFPGSGGWITAENVDEFFDEDGEWKGGAEGRATLGEGAGRVRGREEGEDGGGEGGSGGGSGEGEESKWQRTA